MMNLCKTIATRATPDTLIITFVDGPDWRTTGSAEPQASIHPQRDPFGSESRGGLHWVSEGRVFEDGGAVRLRAARLEGWRGVGELGLS
ncbi:hypothetical protein Sjap_015991 [Stephania japonica]|uniref:Uncharacterized protein n=1 Tax=Stephania japonica TaxID=461633 RepID=A0AAP0IK74_9MAGN